MSLSCVVLPALLPSRIRCYASSSCSIAKRSAFSAYVFGSGAPRSRFDVYAYRAYTNSVSVEFDPKKDAANLKKHDVSLSEGDGVLNDPLALTVEDKSAEGEQRFVTIGMNVFGSLMVVVHAPSGEDVRIISVRRADPKERRNYEKGV